MAGLFGPSEQDLQRLRSTVESLGTTSVPGLAAALSWRARKTERLLAHELQRAGTPLAYDPGHRTVRWTRAPPVSAPSEAPRAPVRSFAAQLPVAPTPVLTRTGFKVLCPSCHVALQPTGSTNLAVCPQCGRLSSARSDPIGPTAPSLPVAATPPVPVPRAIAAAEPTRGGPTPEDRRAQEMFAAWLTSRPIPCPKCRTPLKHRGVGEYSCTACGQTVTFPKNAEPSGPMLPAR
jgi:ribosomal protein L37AE/L43A